MPAPLEHVFAEGKAPTGAPLPPAVKAGSVLFVPGIPAYASVGTLAAGDFPAQARRAMADATGILAAAGAGWDRVAKVNVLLTRREDFEEMNRIYAEHFPDGKYPARTTAIVYSLPRPNFLLEIECTAVLG